VDKLTALTDAKQQTTAYKYDLVSRLTTETDPLNKGTNYGYDAAGNLISKTDANGITITYSYDKLRRLTSKSYPDQTNETYSYDAAGRMLTATNANIGYTFTYDAGNRLTTVTDTKGTTLDYEYDILTTRTKTTLQKGTADEHVTSYGYDTANRPSTITSKTGTFTYTYDSQSRRNSTSYPNGITTSYQYDSINRLTQIKHAAGATTIAFANYSGFDRVGNRKNKTTPTGTENYNYDATYRLTQAATPKGTENYSYDQVGNRLTGPGPKDSKYQYNANNQAIRGKIFGHDYDNNGNQISRTTSNTDKSSINSWDFENRLIKSEQSKGAEKRTVTFKYDPFGRRIEKKLTTIIKGITKTATWNYVYDDDNISLEIYTNEAGIAEKTWYTHGTGTDEHLALERNGSNYFYHADGLGSITSITDSSKAVVQTYSYDSFGNPRQTTGFRNSYLFAGRPWDRETGLYFNEARYYDPMDGRFVSRDPISFAGGDVNLFAYVGSDPVNRIDPSGLEFTNPVSWWLDKHYYRNNNNPNVNFAYVKDKWVKMDADLSVYHTQGPGNENNKKFVSQDGHQELVFDSSGQLVTDSVNQGTYNYGSPLNVPGKVAHLFADMVPYFVLGNTIDDEVTLKAIYKRSTYGLFYRGRSNANCK
jgi:RHS repeat-associated protein